MIQRRGRILAALLLLGALTAAVLHTPFWLEWPREGIASAERKISRHLNRRQVAFLMTFDEPGARDWVTRREALAPGLEPAPGRRGRARAFSGTRWSLLHTATPWSDLEPSHTLSIWIRLLPPSDTQDILYAAAWGRRAGLRLEGGRMTYHVPSADGSPGLSYPFTRWEEWVHIAAVVDADAGTARLYENGVLMAEIENVPFAPPNHNLQFGAARWYSVRAPLRAVLDETVIWNRPLDEAGIQRLATARRPALAQLAPVPFRLWQTARHWDQALRRTLRYLDYFNPRLFHGHARAADLPELHLVLSRRDRRHFNLAHQESLMAGRRTRAAARFRRIAVVADGHATDAELALDGRDTGYPASPRRAYRIETVEPVWDGLRALRLAPPESVGWVAPLLDARLTEELGGVPTRNGLCRLFLNGRFQGIYYYEDDSRAGPGPGMGAELLRAPLAVTDWPFLFEAMDSQLPASRGARRNGLPLRPERVFEAFDDIAARALFLMSHDVMTPFSRRELRHALESMRRELLSVWEPATAPSPARAWADLLCPFFVLGNNPAPLYLREDLRLDLALPDGVSVEWNSSHPELLAPDGRVQPPDGDRPAAVTLTARFRHGDDVAEREMAFRVMPRQPRLPALMIHVHEPLQKSRRVDARIERYDDNPFQPSVHRAMQGRRAGIKFRGNTSFWQSHHRPEGADPSVRKLSFSIRFEEPHRWLNDTATRHLYLGNGYIDIALLRNHLSYSLFRDASEPGAPRHAPDIQWAEVFVNGHYQGVYEMGTRVDRHMLGWDAPESGDAEPPVLYKFIGHGNNFARANPGGIAQKQPPLGDGLFMEPYLQLVQLTGHAPTPVFLEHIEDLVDVDAILDWHLLLNLTENRDGINVNVYLAGHPAAGERLFFIPWDYDKTFAHRPFEWYSNALTTRLWREHPEAADRLARRWAQLRQGPWSEQAILERIARVETLLEGYIEWDHQQWNERYARGRTLAEAIESTRSRALARLADMDQRLDHPATITPSEPEPDESDEDDLW